MTVRETETPGLYFVGYWVNLRPGEESCDCKHACYKDTPCAHWKAAQAFAKGEPVPFWETR